MSAGSGGEPGRDQDPWSRPADFGEPGSAAQDSHPTAPQPEPGGYPSAQQRPAAGFSPANADPWAAPAGGYPSPAGQYQQPSGQYHAPGGHYQQPAGQYPPWAGQYQQPAGGAYDYPQAPYYPTATAARNNPVAIAALVCGIGQFVLGLLLVGNILLAIPAIICGAVGLRQIDQRRERGRGMAIAGLVLGILGVVYFMIVVVLIIIGLHVRST